MGRKRIAKIVKNRRGMEEEGVNTAPGDSTTRQRSADAIFRNTTDGILVTDSDNRIIAVNPAFSADTGYTGDDLAGQTPRILIAGRGNDDFYEAMWRSLAETGRWEGEVWNRHKNGEVVPAWVSITAIEGGKDVVDGYVAIFSDITKRRYDEEKVTHQANYDALTDLPNNRLIRDRIEQAMKHSRRAGGQVGLLNIDLDNFRYLNETLGNGVGDLALIEASRRMRSSIRDRQAIGRLGSDKFVVFLPAMRIAEETMRVARRLLEELAQPMVLKGQPDAIVLTASIGIAIHPEDGGTVSELIEHARAATVRAKERGRNTYQFFTKDMNLKAMEQLSLETRLREALERNELDVHYQPKAGLSQGRLVGMEALVRWESVGQGRVSPARLIALAEETGLIVPLGAWVLRTACSQARAWQNMGLAPLRLAVNFSARQLSKEDLLKDVVEILEQTKFAPEFLELEITESSLMEKAEDAIATLGRLRSMGVHITADDFGTGYSSLNYLRYFPVDGIKIDRSFVADIGHGGAELAAAVIAIGQSLKLKVIAEGVENERQLDFLRERNCDEIQGSLFSPPLPAAEFENLIREDRCL